MNSPSSNGQLKEQTTGDDCPVPHCSLAVIGAPKSGKSSLINAFLQQPCVVFWKSNVKGYTNAVHSCDNNITFIDIWDCSNTETQKVLSYNMIRQSDAFLLVYSLTDPKSFEHVTTLRNEITQMRQHGQPPIIVIIGHKADVQDEKDKQQHVTAELTATCEWGHIYHKTAFDQEEGIVSSFEDAIKSIMLQRNQRRFFVEMKVADRRASFPVADIKQRITKLIPNRIARRFSNK